MRGAPPLPRLRARRHFGAVGVRSGTGGAVGWAVLPPSLPLTFFPSFPPGTFTVRGDLARVAICAVRCPLPVGFEPPVAALKEGGCRKFVRAVVEFRVVCVL